MAGDVIGITGGDRAGTYLPVMRLRFPSLFLVLPALLLGGCASPYSFHTGRTLPQGQSAFTVRVEDLWKEDVKAAVDSASITLKDKSGPAIGAGLDIGLPARLEADLVFVPYRLEGALRWQVNPRRSVPFDLAVDGGISHFIGGWTYVRGGGTLSASLGPVEPYLHGHAIHYLDREGIQDAFVADRTVGGGVSLRLGPVKLLPELDYSFGGDGLRTGFWQFGLALRLESGRN